MQKEKETLVRVKESAWKMLQNRRKIGESMSDTIKRICLEFPEEK